MAGYYLKNEQWEKIDPLLKLERDTRGRKPTISDRQALEGVLYVMREGCRWRSLPSEFGNWMTVMMRYTRWVKKGVFWKILMKLQRLKRIKIKIVFLDATIVRAHRAAAGARKKGGFRLLAAQEEGLEVKYT